MIYLAYISISISCAEYVNEKFNIKWTKKEGKSRYRTMLKLYTKNSKCGNDEDDDENDEIYISPKHAVGFGISIK